MCVSVILVRKKQRCLKTTFPTRVSDEQYLQHLWIHDSDVVPKGLTIRHAFFFNDEMIECGLGGLFMHEEAS